MPYTLTSAEKAELRRKYIANVNRLNQYLPESEKLRVDLKWFNARINDPAEQRFYLKSKRINDVNTKTAFFIIKPHFHNLLRCLIYLAFHRVCF